VTIQLNGDPYELAGPMSIRALLDILGIDPRRVAVEYNRTIVKRAQYDQTMIAGGAEVEIVAFVGGGAS
jgi:thiamine biosynthesis protein ThiS